MKSPDPGPPLNYNPWEYTPSEDTPGNDSETPPAGALTYLSIACTTYCNYSCTFCSKKYKEKNHLDPGFLTRILDQAMELGLKKVELTGGEPLLYPWFREITEYLSSRDITILVVTNGSLITEETAAYLATRNISVSISLSTLNENTYNSTTRTGGRFPMILESVNLLRKAGFSRNRFPVLGIQSIASRQTMDEFGKIRDWAGEQGCMFILNRPIPVGGMAADEVITGKELKDLLSKEDSPAWAAAGAGADAGSHPVKIPFSLDSPCNRLKTGCYIDSNGIVFPCPSINVAAGSLHDQTLSKIWKESPVLETCRNITGLLEGSCGMCPEKHRCYGCRAVAWASWGNLTGPDPGCFHFKPDPVYSRERLLP